MQFTNLDAIIVAMLDTLSRRKEIAELIDYMAGGNVRLALDLVQSFFGSGHVDTQKIVEIQQQSPPYPLILDWIQRTLAYHAPAARPVASLGFSHLALYYDTSTLTRAKVVPVPKVPVPPLSAIGLNRFGDFERMDMAGITYLDTYFVRSDHFHSESLHFHELVHVVQWRLLGPEKFLALYADGLERFGYRNSPLEEMAYNLQDRFDHEAQPFNVETACNSFLM